MTRRSPAFAPDPTVRPGRRTPFLELDLQAVTPIFGGGAQPGVPDPDQPVRPSSVRGHLRFWWRACHGATEPDVEGLFRAESILFGQAHRHGSGIPGPSAVEVEVVVRDPGRLQPYDRMHQHFPAYALFPFQGNPGRNEPPASMLVGTAFTLVLRWARHVGADAQAALEPAVRDAAWAWVTFGGIGARTRRGCGSLFCAAFAPTDDVGTWLRQHAAAHVSPQPRCQPIPFLGGAVAALGGPADPWRAWGQAVALLQDLRQGANLGRNPGRQLKRPGRSRWPEPDSVRQLLGPNGPRASGQPATSPYFPRADLGLPIIFQRMEGEPQLTVDQPDATRFASPIITKPLALAPDRAAPLILALNAPHIWEVAAGKIQLSAKQHGPVHLAADALHDPVKARAVSPLRGRPTAREALIALAEERWGTRAVSL